MIAKEKNFIYELYSDGGARGNPGKGGIGGVIYRISPSQKTKEKIFEFSKYIGTTTNNCAEYQALIYGLEKALELKIKELNCYLDSELVVKQLNRLYKVKEKSLIPLFVRVWNLSLNFKKIKFVHIPREKNKEADFLVNLALDKALKESRSKN